MNKEINPVVVTISQQTLDLLQSNDMKWKHYSYHACSGEQIVHLLYDDNPYDFIMVNHKNYPEIILIDKKEIDCNFIIYRIGLKTYTKFLSIRNSDDNFLEYCTVMYPTKIYRKCNLVISYDGFTSLIEVIDID